MNTKQLELELRVPVILKFVMPSIIMMVILSLYTVVDGIFVSRLLGTTAFSAVNIVYPLLSLTIGLGTMFGSGVTSIISRKLGAGKQREANENFSLIIVSSLIIGMVLSFGSLIFLPYIIRILGADAQVYSYCYAYAFPIIWFFTANILQFQFQNVYIADGKPHIGLYLTIAGGLTNIILDYIFIAKFHMGISGAALATGIGYFLPMVYGIYYFMVKRTGTIRFVKPVWDGHVLMETISNGSSEMVSYLSASVTTFLFNIIMMSLIGSDGVAAVAIILYLDFILVAISMGYSIGIAPLISYHYGKGDHDKVRWLYRLSVGFTGCSGFLITAITLLFTNELTGIFTQPQTQVAQLATLGLRLYALSYVTKGFNIFTSAMYTALGNGRISAILSFLRTFLFLSGFLILLSWLFGLLGVWIASPIAEAIAFLLALWMNIREPILHPYTKRKRHSKEECPDMTVE